VIVRPKVDAGLATYGYL